MNDETGKEHPALPSVVGKHEMRQQQQHPSLVGKWWG
jgi:hypothetical protein